MNVKKLVKPSLGSTIWVRFDCGGTKSFSKEVVLAKGKDIFFHSGCIDDFKYESYRKPLYYEGYGVRWFKSLKEIRKQFKIEKISDDYYEEVYIISI